MSSVLLNNKKVGFQYLPLVLIGLTLLVIGKDLAHSYVRNYSFYLSESLLFGSFWLIFAPLMLIVRKKYIGKFSLILAFVVSWFHIALFSLFVFLVSELLFEHTFSFFQTFIETTSEYGMVCILVYGIQVYFLGSRWPLKKRLNQTVTEKIKVTYQNKTVILDCKDILYVKSEKPYIAIVAKERTYLLHSSLKKFMEEKATENFIQIHKSTIVNTNFIASYVSRKNGDYDVTLTNQQCLRASRSFSNNFKAFFDAIGLA